jgi:acetyl-CoA acyltransferase
VDGIVWGGVVLPPAAPNVGREIALDLGMPPEVEAMTVTRACATGLQAVVLAAAAIERGEADVMIAGGGDSTSNASLTMPPSFIRKVGPVAMSSKSGVSDYFRALGKLSPLEDLVPRKPAIAERTTGEVMGEAAERMAERNQIAREDQDAFAVRSHHRAAAAVEPAASTRRSSRSTVPAGSASSATSSSAPTPASSGSRACVPRSRRTAPSPPATPARSPTAPPRSC